MKQSKRGFTIVELVIVIAVIAVLAAVLIPTFSSLIKKANLSADMQAVRQMNLALKAEESKMGAKPADVETVHQILANAGYNTENWQALTKGYQVYWYALDNVMILYSSTEHKVVYPETVDPNLFLDTAKNKYLKLYNDNKLKAIELDTSLNIESYKDGQTKTQIIGGATTESEKVALESVYNAMETNPVMLNSIGIEDTETAKITASKELTSDTEATGTYASMQILKVESELTSSGDVNSNVYYISVNTSSSATADEIKIAQKAASEYVYSLFTQINSGKIAENAAIIIPGGTTIDASDHEWAPVKKFTGYFGTDNAANPIVINGARLTKATGYSDTMTFEGSGGKYFVTGFWGTLYGKTTIENVTFRNLTMDEPGSNFDMTLTTKQHSRNSIGIIGGIVDDPTPGKANQSVTNVLLKNITVENTVTIKGAATAAGLVGYVGASGETDVVGGKDTYRRLCNGTLTIEGCHVSANVIGGPETSSYGPCGGLIGFSCRVDDQPASKTTVASYDADGNDTKEIFNIIIRNSVFDGKVSGYQGVGAAIGDMRSGLIVFEGTNDFSGATLTAVSNNANMLGVVGGTIASVIVIYFDTADATVMPINPETSAPYPYWQGNTVGGHQDSRLSANKYDTIKDKDGNNIGGNNGKVVA